VDVINNAFETLSFILISSDLTSINQSVFSMHTNLCFCLLSVPGTHFVKLITWLIFSAIISSFCGSNLIYRKQALKAYGSADPSLIVLIGTLSYPRVQISSFVFYRYLVPISLDTPSSPRVQISRFVFCRYRTPDSLSDTLSSPRTQNSRSVFCRSRTPYSDSFQILIFNWIKLIKNCKI
jgi:hypothetical protein